MRNKAVVIFVLTGIFILSGCGSSSDEPSKGKAAVTTNSTNSNTTALNSGSEMAPPQPADANTAATASTDLGSAANRMDSRLQAMRKSGEMSSDLDPAAAALKNARPAPDNSTFTSYPTDAGYEIRTFNNHPQLLKAEKKIAPDGKQSVKIFLRDGKIVEVPGTKIPVLATAPAATLIEAAGFKQPAAPTKGEPLPGSKGQKKSGE